MLPLIGLFVLLALIAPFALLLWGLWLLAGVYDKAHTTAKPGVKYKTQKRKGFTLVILSAALFTLWLLALELI